MRQVRPWSARARRRRRLGVSLAAIALVLLATAVVNVWLAVTTDAGWPLIVAGLELLGGLTVALYAYRYLRRAWLTASMPEEPSAISSTKDNSIASAHE